MKIGFIGLGIMGESMSENIIKKHDDKVFVFDFIENKIKKLESIGAIKCNNSKEVAQNSDIIITMVPKSEHSINVYKEILDCLDNSKICIDMSTIDPSVSIEIYQMIKNTGACFADAPVVKSKPAAIAGKLGIYVGCEEQLYNKIKPVLEYMGENIIYMGKNGSGLVMKICHNTLVAQIQNGVNETITLAQKNGIDVDTFAKAISYGGGQNFYLDTKAAFIRDENYTTAFSVENMNKDLEICESLSEQCNFKMPGMKVSKNVYDKTIELGFGKDDFCATIKAVRE